jgi:hypothetical protein
MEYWRQTVDSDSLAGIFNLPASLRSQKVDVIILPAQGDADQKNLGSAYGCLKKYADPSKLAQEEGAWERSMQTG